MVIILGTSSSDEHQSTPLPKCNLSFHIVKQPYLSCTSSGKNGIKPGFKDIPENWESIRTRQKRHHYRARLYTSCCDAPSAFVPAKTTRPTTQEPHAPPSPTLKDNSTPAICKPEGRPSAKQMRTYCNSHLLTLEADPLGFPARMKVNSTHPHLGAAIHWPN